jgi:hypothetical protein
MMTKLDKPTSGTPTCKRCGRFLRSAEELARGYCARCPKLVSEKPPGEEERFCCGSDPPCPSCPFVVGWGE